MRTIVTAGVGLCLALVATTELRAFDPPAAVTVDLWPATPPGETGPIGEESQPGQKPGDRPIKSLTNVSKPTITVIRPDPEKANGAAVLVCPGGGYNNLAWDHEGEQVATWLNSIGVTAVLLKYRVPRRPGSPKDQPPIQALMDAQRAIGLIRGHASDWGIDPGRLGMLGFSAGGHLTAWTSTNFEKRAYDPIDATDQLACRPDFAILIYPGGVMSRGGDGLSSEIHVGSTTPPMFLAHAGDDRVSPENSALLYLALKKAGVPAELHIYNSGGHGFGLRPGPNPSATWPKRCEEWLKIRGLLRPAEKG